MKLHEEFKEYETLWEDAELVDNTDEYTKLCSTYEGREQLRSMSSEEKLALYKPESFDTLQNILIKAIREEGDIPLEYDGFSREYSQDHFDPGSYYGHYQTSSLVDYDNFTYKVDPDEMFDVLHDEILPKYLDKVLLDSTVEKERDISATFRHNDLKKDKHILIKYKELAQEAEKTSGNSAADEEAVFTECFFLADHLDTFIYHFNDQLLKYYEDEAIEWAEENNW